MSDQVQGQSSLLCGRGFDWDSELLLGEMEGNTQRLWLPEGRGGGSDTPVF